MQHPQPTLKKILIVISVLLGLLLIGIIIHSKINAPKTASISNINLYLKNYKNNKNTFDIISRELYNTISYNTTEDPSKLSDIKIRDNTFSQQKNGTIYSTSFIVDIDSLKQSYRVSYQWDESDESGSNLDEWANTVTCLSSRDEIIYPEFNCVDDFINYIGTDDPIANILPHIEIGKYGILAVIEDGIVSRIDIDIYSCLDKPADEYRNSAYAWLSSQDIDLSDYAINVNYCVVY